MKRKIMSILLSTMLLITTIVPISFAEEQGVSLSKLDYNSLVYESAVAQGISVEERKLELQEKTEEAALNIARDIFNYSNNKKIDLSKYKGLNFEAMVDRLENLGSIEEIQKEIIASNTVRIVPLTNEVAYSKNSSYRMMLGADVQVLKDYSNKEVISGILGNIWSRAISGSYSYTWEQLNAYYQLSTNKKEITITVVGFFEVQVSGSASAGLSIPGFSISSSTSQMVYYRSENVRGTAKHMVY